MTWNREAVSAELFKVFTKHKHTDAEVSESSQIVGDLGFDSLGIMEVLADIEDTFKINIPDEALKDINTIADVAGAIVSRLESDGRFSA